MASLYFIIHKIRKLIQGLVSTSIKLYIHYAHTNNCIILDNLIAYVLDWVWTGFKQDDLYKAFSQSPANGTYSVDFYIWIEQNHMKKYDQKISQSRIADLPMATTP